MQRGLQYLVCVCNTNVYIATVCNNFPETTALYAMKNIITLAYLDLIRLLCVYNFEVAEHAIY